MCRKKREKKQRILILLEQYIKRSLVWPFDGGPHVVKIDEYIKTRR